MGGEVVAGAETVEAVVAAGGGAVLFAAAVAVVLVVALAVFRAEEEAVAVDLETVGVVSVFFTGV